MQRRSRAFVLIPILAIGLGASLTAQATAKKEDRASGQALVKVEKTKAGPTLAEANGRTLYSLSADARAHGKSVCYHACATAWPPLLTKGTPDAGRGVQASLLGTIKRTNGAEQVTYKGHPLYLFYKDTASGQVNGQGLTGFGGVFCTAKLAKKPCVWRAVAP